MIIDTHCHLNFDRFDEDRDAILARAQDNAVRVIVIPAIDEITSKEAISLAETHAGVFACVGYHPNYVIQFTNETRAEIRSLSAHSKVVAIGEIGLDYYWDSVPRDQQKRAFEAQLELATEVNLPVVIHCREAFPDTLEILADWTKRTNYPDRPGVLHSFAGSLEDAKRALDIGFYLGITGPVTFPKADGLRTVARTIPLDRLLIETDAPFLTPQQRRGKRNEPAYVKWIGERIAIERAIEPDALFAATTENARHLFQLGDLSAL